MYDISRTLLFPDPSTYKTVVSNLNILVDLRKAAEATQLLDPYPKNL